MPGQVSRPDDVLAEAACHPRQAGGLQVESLSCLHRKLGAAAVPQGQPVGALVTHTEWNTSVMEYVLMVGLVLTDGQFM